MTRDEAHVAELDGPPETLPDGLMLLSGSAFSMDRDLPSPGDTVIVSWPGGLARGECLEFRYVVKPELRTDA